jgi:hypothetical protein
MSNRYYTALSLSHLSPDNSRSKGESDHDLVDILPCVESLREGLLSVTHTRRTQLLDSFACTVLHDMTATLYDYYHRLPHSMPGSASSSLHDWVTEAEYRIALQGAADGIISHKLKDISTGLLRDWIFVAKDVNDICHEGEDKFMMRMGSYTGSEPLQAGYLIAVLFGLNTPVVLRRMKSAEVKEGQELYEFPGTAYVHGMMDGEAVD